MGGGSEANVIIPLSLWDGHKLLCILIKSLSFWQAPLNIASPSSGSLTTHFLTATHLGVRWTLFLTLEYCNIPCEFPAPCLHLRNSSCSKLPANCLKLHVPSQFSNIGP